MANRMIVEVSGGAVVRVYADTPIEGLEVTVVDFDTDGADESQVYTDREGNRHVRTPMEVEVDEIGVDAVLNRKGWL